MAHLGAPEWNNIPLGIHQFEIIQPPPFVKGNRNNPAHNEQAHNEIAECAKVIAKLAYAAPEPSSTPLSF
jgi:hypothetical protein